MKYIMASILFLGIISAGIAQDNPYENSVIKSGDDSVTVQQPVVIDVFVAEENNEPGATEFGKACSMKRQGTENEADLSKANGFKMKDKDFRVERKENGEEIVKFDNEVEGLNYHKTKNGKVHYKYNYYKDKNDNFTFRRKKNGKGEGRFRTDSDKGLDNKMMQQGTLGVERDVNSCMR